MTSHSCTDVSVNPVERESNNEVQALDLRRCCGVSTGAVFASFPIRRDGNAGSGRCARCERLTARSPADQGWRTWRRRLPRWRSSWRRRSSRRGRRVSRRSGRSTRRGRGRRLRREWLLCHHLRPHLPILRRRRLLRRRSLSRWRRSSRRSRCVSRRSGGARRRSSRCSPWRRRRTSSLTPSLSVAARLLGRSYARLHSGKKTARRRGIANDDACGSHASTLLSENQFRRAHRSSASTLQRRPPISGCP